MSNMKTIKRVFFDVETTGTKFWRHGIHQLSGCIDIDGSIVEWFDYHVKPYKDAQIEDEALAIGHKTREMLETHAEMASVYREFCALLGRYVDKFNKKDKFFLIGYNNASFDNQFLRAWFTQSGDQYFGSWFWANPIDAYVLSSQYLLEKRADMPDAKLMSTCRALGIEVDESKLHDALYDIALTREVYYKVTAK